MPAELSFISIVRTQDERAATSVDDDDLEPGEWLVGNGDKPRRHFQSVNWVGLGWETTRQE